MTPARAMQQSCKVCLRPDKFDFHVPDDIWERVVPPEYRDRVVCLYCFDEFAAARGIKYAASLRRLYFAGRGAVFVFNSDKALDC